MMNKKVLLLSLITSLLFTGCNDNKAQTTDEAKDPNEIVIADFENWGPSFQTICLYDSFGKVTRNENPAFVKSGKYSAHLQPVGNYVKKTDPAVYWPLVSTKFDFAYNDLSYFQKIEVDLFNDSESQIPVTVGFVASVSSIASASLADGEEFALAPGQWTHVVYEPDISVLNCYVDIKNTVGVYLKFPNAAIRDIDEAKDIYVDDIKMINSPTERVIKDLVTIKPNEICDFESDYLRSSITVSNAVANHLTLDFVKEFTADDGTVIKPSHGKQMLHILNKATGDRWIDWSNVRFSTAYLSKTDLKKLTDVEGGHYAIRYEIRFANDGGVLQAANSGFGQSGVFPDFYSADGGRVYVPMDKYVKNKWFTIEVPLCKDITYYTDRHVTVDSSFVLNNAGFGWTIGNETHDVDIFIDNIRISRVG